MITIKTDTDFYIIFTFLADDGTFATGISSPTIDVYEVGGSQVVTAQAMTEIAKGGYYYLMDSDDIDADKQYYVATDGGATLETYRYQSGAFAGNFGNEDTIDTIDGKVDTIDTNVDAILVDTGTTIPATLTTIDTNVDAILVDTGTTIPSLIASRGTGDIAEIVTIKRADGTPIAGVVVWLTTDSAGANAFTDKNQTTNSGGRITFFIEANVTYYVWTDREDGYIDTINRSS